MKRLLARLSLVLMIVFASGASAQVRDTKPPRESPPRDQSSPRDQSTQRDKSAPTDKVATSPRPDLYPAAGGFDPEDETSWILLVGNQGSAPSAATNVRFFLRLTNDDDKITGEISLPALDEGDTHELKLTSIIPTTLIKSLYARIDQPAAVTELNEKNNTFVFKSGRSANADDHSSGDEHEIEYDVAAGALYSRPKDSTTSSQGHTGTATTHRRQEPIKMVAPSRYTGPPQRPIIACDKLDDGKWGCNCGDTNQAICTSGLRAVGCKAQLNPIEGQGGHIFQCDADHSDN